MNAVACARVPHPGNSIEASRGDLVSKGVIYGNGIDQIAMPVQRQEFLPTRGIPHSAASIKRTCDDLGARLVESATGEWQLMPSQNLVQREALGGLIRSLLNEFGDHLLQRVFGAV